MNNDPLNPNVPTDSQSQTPPLAPPPTFVHPSNIRPLSPMTKRSKLQLLIGLVILVLLIGGILVTVIASGSFGGQYNAEIEAKRSNVLANGIETIATSTGEVRQDNERLTRRVSQDVYYAQYTFVPAGTDLEYPAIGEKDYESANNIKAGMKATIKYLPSNPLEYVFISEE